MEKPANLGRAAPEEVEGRLAILDRAVAVRVAADSAAKASNVLSMHFVPPRSVCLSSSQIAAFATTSYRAGLPTHSVGSPRSHAL